MSHSKKDLAKDWRMVAESLINKGVADASSRFESTSMDIKEEKFDLRQ